MIDHLPDAITKDEDEEQNTKSNEAEISASMTSDLIKHLSKEVELATAQMITQRSRNNLLVALGPFVVIGGLATNQLLVTRLQGIPLHEFAIVSGGFSLMYILLGVLAAKIERKFWERANKIRSEIEKITKKPDTLSFSDHGLYTTYMSVFGAIALVFVFAMFILRS